MKPHHALALLAMVLYTFPIYLFENVPAWAAWTCMQLSMLIMIVVLYLLTPPREVGLRCLWAFGTIYSLGELLTDWWLPHEAVMLVGPIEVLIYVSVFTWVMHRPAMNAAGDKRNEQYVFIVFYRPQNFHETLMAALGLPFTSVGVYAGGKWLRFRRSRKTLQLLSVRPTSKKYFMLNTGVRLDRRLELMMQDLEGTPARHWSSLYVRCRCVVAVAPLLRALGERWEPRFLDYVPGVYAYRRLVDVRPRADR